MHNQSPESPDFLDQRGDVRRLNRVPLMITGVLVLLILVAITYTYQMRLAEIQERAAQAENKPSAATPSEVFREAPDGGFIPAKREIVEPAPMPDMTPVNDFDPINGGAATEMQQFLRSDGRSLGLLPDMRDNGLGKLAHGRIPCCQKHTPFSDKIQWFPSLGTYVPRLRQRTAV